jgi:hypothetical protein
MGRKEKDRRYNTSEKGRARRSKYRKTANGREQNSCCKKRQRHYARCDRIVGDPSYRRPDGQKLIEMLFGVKFGGWLE